MKVSLEFKDDGQIPGTLHGEVKVDFNLSMENGLKTLQALRESNIAGKIAKILSKEPATGDEQ